MRRIATGLCALLLAAALYLLLIDTTDLAELHVLGGVALLAGGAFQLSRDQGFAEASIEPRWLARAWRPVARVPTNAAVVCVAAIRQLLERRPGAVGSFRAIPFKGTGGARTDGAVALTEVLGSLAPNTIVLGHDWRATRR